MHTCVRSKTHPGFGLCYTCSTKSPQGVADRQKLAGGEVFRRTVDTCHDKDGKTLGLGLGREKQGLWSGFWHGLWCGVAVQLGWPSPVWLRVSACSRANACTSWSGACTPRQIGCPWRRGRDLVGRTEIHGGAVLNLGTRPERLGHDQSDQTAARL